MNAGTATRGVGRYFAVTIPADRIETRNAIVLILAQRMHDIADKTGIELFQPLEGLYRLINDFTLIGFDC